MSNDNFRRSSEILKTAKRMIPSASQTYSKSYKYFCEGAAPAFLEKGKGAYVWDVDGNKYIDFVLGLGAITVGYNIAEINQAINRQLKKGISFSQPTVLEIELAKKLIRIIPCAEMVKFVKNGSDATSAAVRLARAFTGKEVILCCGYHGWQDWYIGCTENNLGVPSRIQKLIRSFEYNNIGALEKLFRQYRNRVAAVIMEPIIGDGPAAGYLESVRAITRRNKALLIFDEVVSGFRIGLSGAQGYYKVKPDLASFGKGMGNGVPLSVVTGRRDVMKLIESGVFISTTFGGETLSLAGALATIKILEKRGSLEHIWRLGDMWKADMQALIDRKRLNGIARIVGLAPHCGLVFRGKGRLSHYDLASLFQQTLISGGILSLGINYFCLAHSPKHIESFIGAADAALEVVTQAIRQNSVANILKGKRIEPVFKR